MLCSMVCLMFPIHEVNIDSGVVADRRNMPPSGGLHGWDGGGTHNAGFMIAFFLVNLVCEKYVQQTITTDDREVGTREEGKEKKGIEERWRWWW